MKLQKAKKDHECDLCGKKIPKGDKYWREWNIDAFLSDESIENAINRKEHTNCELYKDKNLTCKP